MYGFAGAVGRPITLAGTHFYYFCFLFGLIVSAAVYLMLCIWSPVRDQVPLRSKEWKEPKDYFRPEEDDLEDSVIIEGNTIENDNEGKKCMNTSCKALSDKELEAQ